jgi:putative DNA primase/helicase
MHIWTPDVNTVGVCAQCLHGTLEIHSDPPDLLPFLHSDVGNAQRLISLYGDRLRRCHDFRRWLIWDSKRWAIDRVEQVRRFAHQTMLEFLRQALEHKKEEAERFAKQSLDSRRINGMLTEAGPHLVIVPGQLDTDVFLMNFLNGTVDLRTGVMREHKKEDFITRIVRHDYRPDARCPVFMQFLGRIMGYGAAASSSSRDRSSRLVSYLQKAFGYSLTGSTVEKVVFMAYGDGNNGKTTLLSVFLPFSRSIRR